MLKIELTVSLSPSLISLHTITNTIKTDKRVNLDKHIQPVSGTSPRYASEFPNRQLQNVKVDNHHHTIFTTMLRFAVLWFFVLAAAATAQNPIGTKVTFNNGVEQLGKTCLNSEWKLVQSTILNATLTRRQRHSDA
jgi:hypothetical protein